ncbi:MAG TPA: SCP2 sterol-binding domain-containing protein [Alphaproteobacteria bacterium]|nr:SCP2 sterol-binding domain-containing protein [Alphaproteobacteria bacterium]
MSLETVTESIKSKMALAAGLDAKVKFDFGDDGVIHVDATQSPPEVSHDDKEADCTLKCSLDTFKGFMEGTQDPTMAFMMGKLKVDGSMGLAMKLNSIIED